MKFLAPIKRATAPLFCAVTTLFLAACGGDVDERSSIPNRAPTAVFSVLPSDDGSYLIVDGSRSRDPDGELISYAWEFGNGRQSDVSTAVVVYDYPGSYKIELVVTDGELFSEPFSVNVEVDDLLRPTVDSNGLLETAQVYSGRIHYEQHCLDCHGEDASSQTMPIDLDKTLYAHSSTSSTGVEYSLEAYISNFMPTEQYGGPSACVGDCAANITVYLNWLNGIAPTATPTPSATPTPTAQPSYVMRAVAISNPLDTNIPSGTATLLANLQEGVAVNVNGVSNVGIEVIPSNYESVYGVAFAISGAEDVEAQIDITPTGYYVNEGSGYFDRTMGELPTGDYALTVTIYVDADTPVDTRMVNFTVVDDSGMNMAPVAVDSSTNTVGDAPLTVFFDGSGSSDDGFILSYTWAFGDGSASVTGSASQVQHTYTSPGSYTAVLTVLDNQGAEDSVDIPIEVRSTFDAAAVYTDHCAECHGASGEGVFPFPAIQGNAYTRENLESDITRMFNVNTSYDCPTGLSCTSEMTDYVFENFATEI